MTINENIQTATAVSEDDIIRAQIYNNGDVTEDDSGEADEAETDIIPPSTKEVKEAVHILRRFVQYRKS